MANSINRRVLSLAAILLVAVSASLLPGCAQVPQSAYNEDESDRGGGD